MWRALRQRFFTDTAAAMTELAQLGCARGNFDQGAARACNGASEHLYKHPWCAQSYALAILLLCRQILSPPQTKGRYRLGSRQLQRDPSPHTYPPADRKTVQGVYCS